MFGQEPGCGASIGTWPDATGQGVKCSVKQPSNDGYSVRQKQILVALLFVSTHDLVVCHARSSCEVTLARGKLERSLLMTSLSLAAFTVSK